VFHNLIAIHRAKPNAKCFSAFAWLREISYHDHILVAFMVDTCSNTCHHQYLPFA
jgi:hypothetical protein